MYTFIGHKCNDCRIKSEKWLLIYTFYLTCCRFWFGIQEQKKLNSRMNRRWSENLDMELTMILKSELGTKLSGILIPQSSVIIKKNKTKWLPVEWLESLLVNSGRKEVFKVIINKFWTNYVFEEQNVTQYIVERGVLRGCWWIYYNST